MMAMMSGMQDPSYREAIEGKLQNLKNDPELEKIMKEIETGGPAAMMKCAVVVPAGPYDLRRTHKFSSRPQPTMTLAAVCFNAYAYEPLAASCCSSSRDLIGMTASWPRRYWNDPDVLKKLGTAMGDMPVPGAAGANGHAVGPAADADGEEEEEEEEEATVHSAASTGGRARCAQRDQL